MRNALTTSAVLPTVAVAILVAGARVSTMPVRSGGVGLYGIIEKVVFEPNPQTPERAQVWGAFAYAETTAGTPGQASPVTRGYLYFRIPTEGNTKRETVIAEWRDLQSVAGTGQAVAFGTWGYIGAFEGLNPAARSYILEMYPGYGANTDMRVRPPAEAPTSPAAYLTDTGVIRITEQGSRAAVVRQLKAALAAK